MINSLFPVMNMVDATNKRKMVNAMGARGHSGAVLYFMGHLGCARGGMRVVLWGCFKRSPPASQDRPEA